MNMYRKFKATSVLKRNLLFQRMKNYAQTFSEWSVIFQYGDDANQYEALMQMKRLVLEGEKIKDVRMNILELFKVVTDEGEQQEILNRYIQKYSTKEDLIFAISVSPLSFSWDEVVDKVVEEYGRLGKVRQKVYRQNYDNEIMLSRSTFMVEGEG